jgi:DNA-binding transcriptional MerR regulator
MRIGELATNLGITPDTVRFYEREGLLPRARRRDNGYRDYTAAEVGHLRLLIDLRRLDVPLDEAARIAGWARDRFRSSRPYPSATGPSARRATARRGPVRRPQRGRLPRGS